MSFFKPYKYYKFSAVLALLALVVFGWGAACHAIDVILDSGHSPARPGVTSSTGHKEYQYNDIMLESVPKHLVSRNLQIDLTRGPYESISLQKRANKTVGKKLFVSLHHDSVRQMQKKN